MQQITLDDCKRLIRQLPDVVEGEDSDGNAFIAGYNMRTEFAILVANGKTITKENLSPDNWLALKIALVAGEVPLPN